MVLFLERSDEGLRTVAPPFSTITVSAKDVPSPTTTGPKDAETSPEVGGKHWLWRELATAATESALAPQHRVACIEALTQLKVYPEETSRTIEALSDGPEIEVAIAALRARVARQDILALQRVLDSLSDPALSEAQKGRLAVSIAEVRSSAAVPLLGVALEDERPAVRYRASRALRHISADEVIPLLMRALDDPVPEVAHNAVMGLYTLEAGDKMQDLPGREYAPGIDKFREDSGPYVANWHTWWAGTGRAKYAHVLEGN